MIQQQGKRSCRCIEGLFARELSHRTANMIQQAIAAVHLVRRDGTVHVDAAMVRLAAVAEVNRILSGQEPATIDLPDALTALGEAVIRSLGAAAAVTLVTFGDGLLVDAARARPMLMITAELVGNSARHAFAETGGEVVIALDDDGANTMLIVEDDGRCDGWGRAGGQGRGIVDALAASMGGRVARSRTAAGSSSVTVTMPSLAAAAATPAGSA